MLASGWSEDVARRALAAVMARRAAEARGPFAAGATPLPQAQPGPDPDDPRMLLMLAERPVQRLLMLRQPRLALFGGLLDDDECDALVELARPRLARSLTVAERSGGSEVNAARTSDGMFFARGETALIERIEQRIAELLRWPVQRGEGLQVLRYGPGAQYRPHFDYFDPAQPGSAAVLARGGQRVATLIIYLRVPE
jgi:prolyl 4-hydroxylase